MGALSEYLPHLFEIRASLFPFQQEFPFSSLAVFFLLPDCLCGRIKKQQKFGNVTFKMIFFIFENIW